MSELAIKFSDSGPADVAARLYSEIPVIPQFSAPLAEVVPKQTHYAAAYALEFSGITAQLSETAAYRGQHIYDPFDPQIEPIIDEAAKEEPRPYQETSIAQLMSQVTFSTDPEELVLIAREMELRIPEENRKDVIAAARSIGLNADKKARALRQS